MRRAGKAEEGLNRKGLWCSKDSFQGDMAQPKQRWEGDQWIGHSAGRVCASPQLWETNLVRGAPERIGKVIFPSCPMARHKELFIGGAHLSAHFFGHQFLGHFE